MLAWPLAHLALLDLDLVSVHTLISNLSLHSISLSTMMFTSLLAAVTLASGVQSAAVLPRNNGKGNGNSGRGSDPAFTIPQIQLDSQLSCAVGIENVKKPFLLVPGSEFFPSSNAHQADV